MSDITVRKATANDVAFILDSNLNMAAETEDVGLDPQRLRGGIEYLLGHPREGLYLVAEQAQASVGTLMITFEWSDWRNGRFWWIQSVYVPTRYRRQGVYRAMHEAVRQLASADPQACGLRLYVERDNHPAQQTYQHIGMSETHYRLYEELLRPAE
jgi:ribosomal protein S18 acetylase RimI-like enzyme